VRVGIGYDSHRFTEGEGRRLILGGVEIPHPRGLVGHSDADAVAHALTDAILGAAGLGDIGQMFPPTDPRWRDADSLDLLKRAYLRVVEAGLTFISADITVIIEQPRLARYLDDMREKPCRCAGERVLGGLGQSEDERGHGVDRERRGGRGARCGAARAGPRLSDLLAFLERLPPGPLYGLITALAALENFVPPLPADTAVALGAFLAGRGRLNLWTVFGLTWVANVASASLVYWLARRYGREFFMDLPAGGCSPRRCSRTSKHNTSATGPTGFSSPACSPCGAPWSRRSPASRDCPRRAP